jgi:hypothetical protein
MPGTPYHSPEPDSVPNGIPWICSNLPVDAAGAAVVRRFSDDTNIDRTVPGTDEGISSGFRWRGLQLFPLEPHAETAKVYGTESSQDVAHLRKLLQGLAVLAISDLGWDLKLAIGEQALLKLCC